MIMGPMSGSSTSRGSQRRTATTSCRLLRRVKGRSQLPGYVEKYLNGEIKLDPMITHVLPLERINDAFELMHQGKSIRSVIKF